MLRPDGKGEGGFPWVKIERRITLVQKYRHWNIIHQDCPLPVSLWSVHFIISLLPITVTLLFTTKNTCIRVAGRDFPGGPVVKNLPASAGDTGSIPGLRRLHMTQGN